MTETEWRQFKEKERRDQLLERLKEASSKRSRVVKPQKSEEEKTGKEILDSVVQNEYTSAPPMLSDAQFNDLTSSFLPEINPLEESTGENILGYYSPNEDDEHRFSNLYKSEIAMISQILKRVNEQSTWVNQKLRGMNKSKGPAGVGKNYSDLVNAANSLHSTTLQAIKNIADLKKIQVELTLKDEKANAENSVSIDDTADSFYSMIVGNRKEFIEHASGGNIGSIPYQYSATDETYPNNQPMRPIPSYSIGDYNNESTASTQNDSDEAISSYIRYEGRHVDVCVLRYPDDTVRFAGIDEDGLEVDDYEVPGDDLLETLSIQPMANYAYDKTGRKFRIIDINTDGVDLSDIDSDDYEYTDPNEIR